MRRIAPSLLVSALVFAGCSSAPPPPAPAAAKAQPTPSAEELAERERRAMDAALAVAGRPPLDHSEPVESAPGDWEVVTDQATGRRLMRVPKSRTLRVVNGKLRHSQMNPKTFSFDLVKEDADFYYVEAPPEPVRATADAEAPPEGLAPILSVDPLEYEVVTPARSRLKLRLEEKSEGLPTTGFWRSNLDVGDVDGDGRPEVVTTPPRLGGGDFRIFRYDGGTWTSVTPELSGDETLNSSYGGVAVRDLDGDGKLDVVTIGHGSSPFVSFNEGGFRFRREDRGLPHTITGRAVAAGDLDGDGRMDLVTIADESEMSAQYRRESMRASGTAPRQGDARPVAAGDDARKGYNARAFRAGPDGKFVDASAGLEESCWGYGLAFVPKPVDGGAPFFASGCRTTGSRNLLYEWDAASKSWKAAATGVIEAYGFHSNVAAGTYMGKPAVFATWVKANAPGTASRPIRGQGLSIYYRDGGEWKRKRVEKALANVGKESQGIGVGDLDGDGLDDVVLADDVTGRVRVFFQTRAGEFEELDPALEPAFVNRSMSVKVVDIDGDGRNDIVLMYEYRTGAPTRAGGLRFFRNAG